MADSSWTRPDLPSKCTYTVGTPINQSPHSHNLFKTRPRIAENVTDLIGSTPLVRLNRIPQSEGLECEILVKCEFLNPGGSVKDRIAHRMIEEAERSGHIKPGDTLIEPTSGNTGIGLALIAAIKGYHAIIVMPEKMSSEKENVLRGLGAEIVRTPTSACFDDPDSHLRVAEKLKHQLGPHAHILNQYVNPYNPIEHYDQTAEEILHDCTEPNGKVKLQVVVSGTGTGGTLTGISRKIKEVVPQCKLVAVDPEGSVLAHTANASCDPYDVEGIGYDFIPTVLDRSAVDKWYKTADGPSLLMARRLMKEEGLLCGGSSGSAMVAALLAAKDFGLGKGDRMVVILPDSIRNYMTKHLSDYWMYNRGFVQFPAADGFRKNWIGKSTESLVRTIHEAKEISSTTAIGEAVKFMKEHGLDRALVTEEPKGSGVILGVLDRTVLQSLLSGKAELKDPVLKVIDKSVRKLPITAKVDELARRLMTESCVIVQEEKATWIVGQEDFLNWTVSNCN